MTALSYRFDNLQNVSLNFNANGWFDQVLDFTGLNNGQHTLTIAATDTAGNIKTIQYAVTVIIDRDAPVITASLLHDTAPNGQTNSDRITFDPTITGTVIDASRVAEFKAGFDSTQAASFTNVTAFRNANGSFTFDRTALETIYGGTLPDGFHTLHLQAVDEFHNTSNIFDFSFTFDSTTSEPIFNLNPVSDSGVVGDFHTKFDTVTLTGLAEANSTVVLEQTGAVTTSDNNAQNQLYSYTVVATDPENDPLTFSLGRKPVGMTIDNGGTIRWTPQVSQIGSQQVEVFARDAQGAVTTQTYTIEVGAKTSTLLQVSPLLSYT